MSERRFFVGIENTDDLNFDYFYDTYLNSPDGDFEECYLCFGDSLKSEMKKEWEIALNYNSYFSNNLLINRTFVRNLAQYISEVGIPIKVEDIAGHNPQIIILTKDNKTFQKYLNEPSLEVEERFNYMKHWALTYGLTPGIPKESL